MKIKMLTTKSGPVVAENWTAGEEREVCVEEARYWHAAKVCNPLEPYPGEAGKAVSAAPERAVIKPTETAKAVVTPELVKVPVAAPAKSTTVASVKAATWGTPEVKA